MALSRETEIFKFYGFTAINKTTGLPYGKPIRVTGGFSLTPNNDVKKLTGGANDSARAIEFGSAAQTISATAKGGLPDWVNTLAGYTVTSSAAEASGSTSTITNSTGTSVANATTGIASVGVKSGSEADLKPGTYFVKAASSTTVDIYMDIDLNHTDGTDVSFQDDNLKLLASALTVTTDTAVTVTGCGVELTGGSGTIGLTADDVAIFTVKQINDGSAKIEAPQFWSPPTFTGHFYSKMSRKGDWQRLVFNELVLEPFGVALPDNDFQSTDLSMHVLGSTDASPYYIETVRGVKI